MKSDLLPSGMKKDIQVLIVDDEPHLLDIAQRFLEKNDFCTECASSADEALQKIRQYPYDVIVSDYNMPGKDGIEFLIEVRATLPCMPFILFTGRGREEIAIRALNEGADFYIQKGGDPKSQFVELSHKIRRAVERCSAAAAIKERNEVLGAILAASPFGITLVKNRTIQWLNEPLASMLGYEENELIGSPVRILYPDEEEYLRVGNHIIAELKVNGESKIRTRLMKKDETQIDCEIQMACLNIKNPLFTRMVTIREIQK
jgi:PAS domain S-box-containing protein